MKLFKPALGLIASLFSLAAAEDILFLASRVGAEYTVAQSKGYTTKIVSDAQWRAMSTADFAAFKGIAVSDNGYGFQTLTDTRNVWGPAVQGNIFLLGGDPSNHIGAYNRIGVLIANALSFITGAKDPATQSSQTGLYLIFYNYISTDLGPSGEFLPLSYFGTFITAGYYCDDDTHLVASAPTLNGLADGDVSNWGCSVHSLFPIYPKTGRYPFSVLAILKGNFPGAQTFADGTTGSPWILARGVIPGGCGDGTWNAMVGEECDDGNLVAGDGCSPSCKCEFPLKADGAGSCVCNPPLALNAAGKCVGCGDAVLQPGEECDDANAINGDGCSSDCKCDTPFPFDGSVCRGLDAVLNGPKRRSLLGARDLPEVIPNITTQDSYELQSIMLDTLQHPTVIGKEIIQHVTISTFDGRETLTNATVMERSIWNFHQDTMPDYLAELASEGMPYRPTAVTQFLTVSTTACDNCQTPTSWLPVVCTDQAAAPVTLTRPAPWLVTPSPEEDTAWEQYVRPPPNHTHHHDDGEDAHA